MIKNFYKILFFIISLAFIILYEILYPVPKDFFYFISNIIASSAIIVVYIILGLKLSFIFKIKDTPEKYIFGFLFSIVFIGTFIFLTGFLKVYNYYFFYFLTVIFILFTIKELKIFLYDVKNFLKKFKNHFININTTDFFTYSLILFLIIYSFISILTPPIYYDELTYHLALPSQYLSEGKIFKNEQNIFSFFPSLMQMNYIYFLSLCREIGVKIFNFSLFILALILSIKICDLINASKKWFLLLLISFPLFLLNSIRVTSELPFTLFILAIFYVILSNNLNKNEQLVIIGILSGAILAIKYTGFIIYFFILFYFLYFYWKKEIKLNNLLFIIFIPLLIIFPYLCKNFIYIKNPFYPFLADIFNSDLPKQEANNYINHLNNFGVKKNFFNLFLFPFLLVFKRELFGGDIISPIFLISLLFVFITFKDKLKILWLFCFYYLILWFLTSQVMRFLLPVMIFFLIIACYVIKNINLKYLNFIFSLIFIIQVLMSFYFVERYITPFQIFLKKKDDYLSQKISYYNAATFLNRNFKKNENVLLLGEARTFYFKQRIFTNTVFNENRFITILNEKGENEFNKILKEKKIKYIMINFTELDRLKTSGFEKIYDCINSEKFKKFIDINAKKIYSDIDSTIWVLNN